LNRDRLASLLRHRTARDPRIRQARDAAWEVDAELWLVGGYVRDSALERRATDVDLVVGRGRDRLVPELRRRWATRGFRFRKRGVTTWRFRVRGHEIDVVDASRRGLDRDLARREFTINAIAFDLTTSRVLDPLKGLADLRARRLRLPRSGVIREDPLRALRAARFLAQLPRFTLEREARRQVSTAGTGLRRASPERVRDELDKLLASDDPARGLAALEELGLVGAVLPELVPLASCVAGAERPDVWRHTLDALARSAPPRGLPGRSALGDADGRKLVRWALLLHDISKPETFAVREDGRPTFHGHEVLGVRRAEALLVRLRVPRDARRRIGCLILNHLRPSQLAEAGAPARGLRRLVREAGEDLPLLAVHAACDALASGAPDHRPRWRRLRRVLDELIELWERRTQSPPPVLVDGRDVMRALGLGPGKRIGELLASVREHQESGELTTRREALAWLRSQLVPR
jgi:putative nucleotidyltransferase with HDIG domain